MPRPQRLRAHRHRMRSRDLVDLPVARAPRRTQVGQPRSDQPQLGPRAVVRLGVGHRDETHRVLGEPGAVRGRVQHAAVEEVVVLHVAGPKPAAREREARRHLCRLPVAGGERDLDAEWAAAGLARPRKEVVQRPVEGRLGGAVAGAVSDVAHGRRPLPPGERHQQHDDREADPASRREQPAQQQRAAHERAEPHHVAAQRIGDHEPGNRPQPVQQRADPHRPLPSGQREVEGEREQRHGPERRERERGRAAVGERERRGRQRGEGRRREREPDAACAGKRVGERRKGEEEPGDRAHQRADHGQRSAEPDLPALDREQRGERRSDPGAERHPPGQHRRGDPRAEPERPPARGARAEPAARERDEQRGRHDRREPPRAGQGRGATRAAGRARCTTTSDARSTRRCSRS